MPELPEVQTVVTSLQPRLIGKRVRSVRLARKDMLEPAGIDLRKELVGQRIASIHRRAKRIVFELSGGCRFYIHLGMTGQLTIESADAAAPAHTHLFIGFGRQELRFRDPRRFGGIWWLGCDGSAEHGLGPEPLTMRPSQLAERLSKSARPIKNALMDQAFIAGLGNIYVDESLFAAGIHPLTPANLLTRDQVSRLNRSIKSTLRRALKHRGSTLRDYRDADGSSGEFQKLHRVYDRAGQNCVHCRRLVQRIVLGGRSTHFCSACQPLPRRRTFSKQR